MSGTLYRTTSIQTAVERITDLVDDSVSAVSFDVFDTLVLRKIHSDAVLVGAARWLEAGLSPRGEAPLDVLAAYHQTYVTLAQRNADGGGDFEVHAEALFMEWVNTCFPRTDPSERAVLTDQLIDRYQQQELWACVPNLELRPLVERLHREGRHLIYISDMYLPKRVIDRILEATGWLDFFSGGYVSSDCARLKRTGQLYHHVMSAEGLEPEAVVHIGDNLQADGTMARQKGLHAVVIEDTNLTAAYYQKQFDWRRFEQDRRWAGYLIASAAATGIAATASMPTEEAYGFRILGPIFANFIHRVIERCRVLRIRRIYFIAREGLFLKELFDRIAPEIWNVQQPLPETHYFYVSRLTAFYLAAKRIGPYELSCTEANGPLTIANLFSPLKIDSDELSVIAARHGFSDISANLPPDYMMYPPFQHLLDDPDIQYKARSKYEQHGRLLETYLEQIGFLSSPRVALVDVGWAAQIQNSLYRGLRHRNGGCPKLVGMYLGVNLTAHLRKTPDSWIEWALSDQSHLDWAGMVSFYFPHVFEAIVRAPHGTVIGYRKGKDGLIEPELKLDNHPSRKLEKANEGLIAMLQHGVLRYLQEYSRAVDILGASATDTRPYALEMLERMIRYPSREEADMLFKLKNISDLGSDHSVVLGQRADANCRTSLKALYPELRQSFWKHGTLALKASLPMRWLWILGRDAMRHVHPRKQSLDEGIVFHQPCQHMAGEPGCRDTTTIGKGGTTPQRRAHDEALILEYRRVGRTLYQRQKERTQAATRNEMLRPLTVGEALHARIVFKAARYLLKITGRHGIYRQGLPLLPVLIRNWIVPRAMRNPLLTTALRCLRRLRMFRHN